MASNNYMALTVRLHELGFSVLFKWSRLAMIRGSFLRKIPLVVNWIHLFFLFKSLHFQRIIFKHVSISYKNNMTLLTFINEWNMCLHSWRRNEELLDISRGCSLQFSVTIRQLQLSTVRLDRHTVVLIRINKQGGNCDWRTINLGCWNFSFERF